MLFTKMHGLGNDFIVIEDFGNVYEDYSRIALKVCDRHFGIGADGILVAKRTDKADSRMLIFNSDGSQAEMCGNGIRCFAKYIYDKNIVHKKTIEIETLDGVKKVELEASGSRVSMVSVDMGVPIFSHKAIPINIEKDMIVDEPVFIGGTEYRITSMLLGVPHTVLFVDDMESTDLSGTGSVIENSRHFPRKTNVNFVKVMDRDEFAVRTWERGAGLTLACGTGTCASLVAGVLNNKIRRKAKAQLFGGDLIIEWHKSGTVYMTGPAETVFTGEYRAV